MLLTLYRMDAKAQATSRVSDDMAQTRRFPIFTTLSFTQFLQVPALSHSLLVFLTTQQQEAQLRPTYMDPSGNLQKQKRDRGRGIRAENGKINSSEAVMTFLFGSKSQFNNT